MNYNSRIYWDGENPRIQNKAKFIEWLKQFPEDQWFEFNVMPIGNINNSDQSKLYHKWCDILAEEFGWESGTEMHKHFKDVYNNGKSTKSFDTKEWSQYMTKVLAFAGTYNIKLPTGNEKNL